MATKRTLPADARLIPDTAKKVFTGEIFDVYHWSQKLYDGSVETFEMLRRPDTVLVIAIDGESVVVQDETQPGGISRTNHVPVGRVDDTDASVLEAAQRELREETGLQFSDWNLLTVVQREAKIEWFVHVFVASGDSTQGVPQLDAGERITVKRQPFSDFQQKHRTDYPVLDVAVSAADFVARVRAI